MFMSMHRICSLKKHDWKHQMGPDVGRNSSTGHTADARAGQWREVRALCAPRALAPPTPSPSRPSCPALRGSLCPPCHGAPDPAVSPSQSAPIPPHRAAISRTGPSPHSAGPGRPPSCLLHSLNCLPRTAFHSGLKLKPRRSRGPRPAA